MERPGPYSRADWLKHSQERQCSVDRNLDQIAVDLEYANCQLREIVAVSPRAARQYGAEAAHYLNQRWEHYGETFLVSGRWYVASVSLSPSGVRTLYSERPARATVVSAGFAPLDYRDQHDCHQAWIGMSFYAKPSSAMAPGAEMNRAGISYFADPRAVSLHRLQLDNPHLTSSRIERITDTIARTDRGLRSYLDNPDSGFYKLDAQSQTNVLYSFAETINTALPAPDSLERLIITHSRTPVVYIPNYQGAAIKKLTVKPDSELVQIIGTVEAATFLDYLDEGGRQRRCLSPDTLSAAVRGPGLLITPQRSNIQLPDYHGQPLIVPYRSFSELELDLAHVNQITTS